MEWLLLIPLVALLFLFAVRKPARKVRILYLGEDRTNYIRFRPNPGIQINDFHWCRSNRRKCSHAKSRAKTAKPVTTRFNS